MGGVVVLTVMVEDGLLADAAVGFQATASAADRKAGEEMVDPVLSRGLVRTCYLSDEWEESSESVQDIRLCVESWGEEAGQ